MDVWRVERRDGQPLFLWVDDSTVLDAPVSSICEDLSSSKKNKDNFFYWCAMLIL
jgi:hypothetical protein